MLNHTDTMYKGIAHMLVDAGGGGLNKYFYYTNDFILF